MDVASSGAEAESALLAAGDPYRVVLTDWQMPGMNGIELARRIAGNPALRVPPSTVLVTAFGREEVQQEAEAAGIRGFLCKPVGQSVLVDTLVALFAPPRAPNGHGRRHGQCGETDDCVARVLLVEDNQVNQQIALELLQAQGIDVDVAANGMEALAMLHDGGPQAYALVLMDLEMLQLDGHAATVELRKDARFDKVPVVAMTAHALAEIRERCLREGMQDYISKPVEPEKLYATLAPDRPGRAAAAGRRHVGRARAARTVEPVRHRLGLRPAPRGRQRRAVRAVAGPLPRGPARRRRPDQARLHGTRCAFPTASCSSPASWIARSSK